MASRNWFLLVSLIIALELLLHLFLPINSTIKIEQFGQIEPLAKQQMVEFAEPQNNKKIYFVGDLMMARNVERRLVNTDVKQALSNMMTFWSDQFVVANFESAVPLKHLATPDFTFRFSVKKELLPDLQAAGITHVSLANNHAFDFGQVGYKNTVTEMNNIGIVPFGDPYDLSSSSVSVISTGDSSIALIGLSLITSEIDFKLLKEMVEKLSQTTDLQFVYIHWGNEYVEQQSQTQRQVAAKLSKIGIDVVIGHHPHVIQGVERIDNTLVFYSLGNFLFDQYFSEAVQQGLMLELATEPDSFNFSIIPVSSLNSKVKPFLPEATEKTKILENLAELSNADLKDSILTGKLILPRALATSPEVVIMTQ